ncbi:MAG: hypothetical protein QXL16_02500 [Candidatus Micrarchaeaceae archaeon]
MAGKRTYSCGIQKEEKMISYLKDYRIISLIFIIVALLILDLKIGLHLGIEFIGGTTIPVSLDYPANPLQLSQTISALQQRLSTFGLKEVTLEGVGNQEIYITIPNATSSEINQTIQVIESQGVFEGIVNGKEALNGSSILQSGVGVLPVTKANGTYTWGVQFVVTQGAAERFSKVVFGEANKPIYMFLDRPSKAILLLNQSLLSKQYNLSNEINAMNNAATFGNSTIPILIYTNPNSALQFLKAHNSTYKRVIAYGINQSLEESIKKLNYTLIISSPSNMTPQFSEISLPNGSVELFVSSWPAIGLLSAPVLNPSITNGSVSEEYEISGVAPLNMSPEEQFAYANQQAKEIASILSGGSLPIPVIVQRPYYTPPTLGKHFEYVSGIAGVLSIAGVMALISTRYRKLKLIFPIFLTTASELFIIISIIGLVGTIDIPAVAGIIAVVGTGVDAQIIITDELIRKEGSLKMRYGNAFYIIWVDALLLIIAMLPLLFSTSLVSIIGFAEATILGALIGVLLTRPAYAAIVSKMFEEK